MIRSIRGSANAASDQPFSMWYERSAFMYPLIVMTFSDLARHVAIQSVIVMTDAEYGKLCRPMQKVSYAFLIDS